MCVEEVHVPDSHAPDVVGSLLLKERANLLDLGATAGGIEEEIAQLTAIGDDINRALCNPWIALEHQDLVFRPASVMDGLHGAAVTRCCRLPLEDRRRW